MYNIFKRSAAYGFIAETEGDEEISITGWYFDYVVKTGLQRPWLRYHLAHVTMLCMLLYT